MEVIFFFFWFFFRGLLASKMYKTAKSIVINLISFIDEYGFVLNGARTYYTNRRYLLIAITFCYGSSQHFLLIANLCHYHKLWHF